MTSVIELYPAPGMSRPLHGLYLDQDLRQTAGADGFVYTNFISSLDGRIAMPGPNDRPRVPPAIANAKDWRLFQELAAQADVLLTSGRYLREYHPTNSQDVLAPYADPALRDLEQWRLARGCRPIRPSPSSVPASISTYQKYCGPSAGRYWYSPGLITTLTGRYACAGGERRSTPPTGHGPMARK